ncbi:MAG TPA: DEAD/DEAH box helicase [Candidatus Acidoferrum sp.]|nr:DEAD/DEAH box helicase [Candidatus Acidoferrum sp.]
MPYAHQRRFSTMTPRHQHTNRNQSTSRKNGRKEYINPARFIQAGRMVEQTPYVPTHRFADFAVAPLIQTNLKNKGFDTPTPIQDQTIPLGLEGKDIVGLANTGTGKTAAFALPVLNRVITDKNAFALIVAPTRELAQQIEAEFHSIGRGAPIYGALLIGGTPMGPQLRSLRSNPQVVIGTPGRIKDHLKQRSLDLSKFNIVVLDEVDQMLDMGFIIDVRFLLSQVSPNRQSLFFSATMDERVKSIIEGFAHNPVHVSVKTGVTTDNVAQDVVHYGSKEEKLQKLHDLLAQQEVTKALIFDDTQRSVEKLHKELLTRGFSSDSIHGGKSQPQRQRALGKFKTSEVNVLVATDVAARGIDIADISHVINYATPKSYQDYVHRIGRAGRAGKLGKALTFIER